MLRRIAAQLFAPGPKTSDSLEISDDVARWPKLRGLFFWVWRNARRIQWSRYLGFFVLMLVLAHVLGRTSGLSGLRYHLRIEAPILLASYWAFNFLLRPGKLAPFIAAFPLAIIYAGYDFFYIAWGNVFKVIDFQNLPELLKVLPMGWEIALLLALGLPIVLVLCFINYRRYWRLAGIVVLAALLLLGFEVSPTLALGALDRAGFQVAEWSDAETVNENGRITSLLYFEGMRRKALAETATYRNRGDYEMQVRTVSDFIRKHGNHRNVHLIVLESLIDPTLLAAVSYSQDPRHPDFAKLVGDKQSFSISPVFGGETAQAEFEVLCGVPALQRLSEIEFDDFTGEPAGCMPGILSQAGYLTTVSNSFEPNYFNSTRAYTGIGFQNIYFPAEYGAASSSYLSLRNVSESEQYLFDGDLFDQNLSFVARALRENPNRPILNYLLGIYGHEPHDIDTDKRPLVLSAKAPYADDQLVRSANQYWYRTQAIAHYVRALTKLDPKSLIIIVSDHLPPLGRGVKTYQEFRYLNNSENSTHMNRILIFENGRIVKHKTIHHYEVPSVIYDYLTAMRFCSESNCTLSEPEFEEKYMSLMAHAVGRR